MKQQLLIPESLPINKTANDPASPAEQVSLDSSFQQFVQSCAFLHDDWEVEGGVSTWGQYDTSPYLLGAKVCVSGSLAGFGERYIAYMRSLNAFPEYVIIPEKRSLDLTDNLLHDERALGELRQIMANHRLDLSVFYSLPSRHADELRKALVMPGHAPRIFPNADEFAAANDKLSAYRFFEEAGIPIPEYALCSSPEEVLAFAGDRSRSFSGVVIKQDHRSMLYLHSGEVHKHVRHLRYPVVIETYYPTRVSPSINCFILDGKVSPLFATRQHLSEMMNWGNDGPACLLGEMVEQMVHYTEQLARHVPIRTGVIGTDYIFTIDRRLLAVDLNPRFCSPTYPFYFLQRHGFDLSAVHVRYRVVKCCIPSLTHVFEDPAFVPLAPGQTPGMFIYNPVVYDHTPKLVNYLAYVLVADSIQELDRIDECLRGIIERLSK